MKKRIIEIGFVVILLLSVVVEGTSNVTLSESPEPPVTSICYDSINGIVSLYAVDYPEPEPSGVKATYYRIGSVGNFNIYEQPFKLPEGTHTVYFYSEDNVGNLEGIKQATFTFDSTPPTVTITSPEAGKVYLFGEPIFNRISSLTALCIGKVPISVTADDGVGTGVNKVLFSYNNETSWDDTEPYEDVFRGFVFGDLTITVTAIDNLGHESEPVEMTIKCYSLG